MSFTSPVCTKNGIIFEKDAIEAFLTEHKCDPVTGEPMTAKDLIVLNMDKDEEGRWQCPVLTKPFADHTKIVAIVQNPPGKEANVYSHEAYQVSICGPSIRSCKEHVLFTDARLRIVYDKNLTYLSFLSHSGVECESQKLRGFDSRKEI